ncbi:serine/threonine-protein kinase STY13-like [Nicotiana tabacum]|uniref:Serine/threonine-protein kinase HT1-like n=2 Tax=Nicotiana TaxID=4085 RepID=A0A1S3YII8_TOBAC|nr:PREDICTED: serine/threonine-protein kinase HT1-like [Nicotiana sylvestris]XP_016452071.1 PREDICTED: serine/threonine-protein kinase HT1-like [Nicotiana tabacum]
MADEKDIPNLDVPKSDNLDSQNVTISIDKSLLIDLQQLSIGPIISEARYSVVYQGLYKSQPVAIKVIQPEKCSNVSPERKVKFEREITMLSRVKHDNIMKFIGVSMEPALILVTELMKGDTLQKYLWSIRPHCPDLNLSLSFALGISRAMEYLHAIGIIHRDLKPSNLLLTEDKTRIKLADFGLARVVAETEMTAEAGTYRWMAPELLYTEPADYGAKKHYNHKVDVYSFSMVLWELLTNDTPFKGKTDIMAADATAKNLRPSTDNIPKEILPLISSCWSEDPADRPEFAQISDILANILGDAYIPQMITPDLAEGEQPDAYTPQTITPNLSDVGQSASQEIANSPGTSSLMDKGAENKKKKSKSWLCCFKSGYNDNLQ